MSEQFKGASPKTPLLLDYWKPVYGFESVYEISVTGRVRRIGIANGATVGRILKTRLKNGKYPKLELWRHNRRFDKPVHTALAETFIGPRPLGLEVNHIDGCPPNCQLSNLEYLSPEANRYHALINGLIPHGTKHYASKLSPSDVLENRRIGSTLSVHSLANRFGVTHRAIQFILSGRNWKHVA